MACGEKEVTSEKKARDIFISTTQVKLIDFKEQESSMGVIKGLIAVSYTHLRAHETSAHLVCRLLLEKKKIIN